MYISSDFKFICYQQSMADSSDLKDSLKELGFKNELLSFRDEDKFLTHLKEENEYNYIIINNSDNDEIHTVVGRIRAIPHYIDTAILVMTNLTTNEVMKDCLNAGATEYIVKPFSLEVLASKIVNSFDSSN